MIHKSNKAKSQLNVFLLLYMLITLFLGESVQQYLHLGLEKTNLLASIHLYSLPFLLLSVISSRKLHLMQLEKFLILFSILFVFVNRILFDKTGGLSGVFNWVIEPILLISILRTLNDKELFIIRRIILVFLIVEFAVAAYETLFGIILFADVTSDTAKYLLMDMRAYALHGHPLQNAFLICILGTIILYSSISNIFKYLLFVLCFISITMFNTRSSIYILSLVFVVYFLRNFLSRTLSFKRRLLLIISMIIMCSLVLYIMVEYSLGSRMAYEISPDEGSANTRFLLIGVLLNMSVTDVLFGPPEGFADLIKGRYGFVAIENSFVNIVFGYGLIFLTVFSVCSYKIWKRIGVSNDMFYMTIVAFFLLMNANNAIVTTAPIIPFVSMCLFAFKN